MSYPRVGLMSYPRVGLMSYPRVGLMSYPRIGWLPCSLLQSFSLRVGQSIHMMWSLHDAVGLNLLATLGKHRALRRRIRS